MKKSLTVEFVYPKYSYEDYFDIDQSSPKEADEGKEETDSELATPLHPWLQPSTSKGTSSNATQASSTSSSSNSFTSNGLSSGFSPSSFMSGMGMGSVDSFMSSYTGGTSSFGSGGMSAYTGGTTSPSSGSTTSSNKKVEHVTENPIVEDDDAGALIW